MEAFLDIHPLCKSIPTSQVCINVRLPTSNPITKIDSPSTQFFFSSLLFHERIRRLQVYRIHQLLLTFPLQSDNFHRSSRGIHITPVTFSTRLLLNPRHESVGGLLLLEIDAILSYLFLMSCHLLLGLTHVWTTGWPINKKTFNTFFLLLILL